MEREEENKEPVVNNDIWTIDHECNRRIVIVLLSSIHIIIIHSTFFGSESRIFICFFTIFPLFAIVSRFLLRLWYSSLLFVAAERCGMDFLFTSFFANWLAWAGEWFLLELSCDFIWNWIVFFKFVYSTIFEAFL